MNNSNSNDGQEPERIRSGSTANRDEGFIARLKELIDAAGGQHPFSRLAGVSQGALQRYLAGGDPSRRMLLAISKAAHVRLEWLATGQGPVRDEEVSASSQTASEPPASLDHDFGGIVSEAVLNLYREENARLPTAQILAIGFEKYEEIMSASTDPAERGAMLKLVLQQLRKDLRAGTKATTHGKRSA